MKNLFLIVFVAAIVFAFQPKSQLVVADLAEVNALMETYLTAWNVKDVKTLNYKL